MWSDNIAQRDDLGFEVHANLIKGLVDEPGMLPITIGVLATGVVENQVSWKL